MKFILFIKIFYVLKNTFDHMDEDKYFNYIKNKSRIFFSEFHIHLKFNLRENLLRCKILLWTILKILRK